MVRPSRLVLGKKFFQIWFIYTPEGCVLVLHYFFLQSVIYETPYCTHVRSKKGEGWRAACKLGIIISRAKSQPPRRSCRQCLLSLKMEIQVSLKKKLKCLVSGNRNQDEFLSLSSPCRYSAYIFHISKQPYHFERNNDSYHRSTPIWTTPNWTTPNWTTIHLD